jgi:hypothetical protein
MVRVFLDEHGAYTKDLFVKIDGTPSHVFIADTTWLSDFFQTHEVNSDASLWREEQLITARKANVALLIQFWQRMLLSDQPTCYLPFDLADQSSAALRITKGKKLYQIKTVWTTDIVDGTPENYFLESQENIAWHLQPAQEWMLAPSSILTGLNWSLARLELPSIPLRYE